MSKSQDDEVAAAKAGAERRIHGENAVNRGVRDLSRVGWTREEIKAAVDRVVDSLNDEAARRIYRDGATG